MTKDEALKLALEALEKAKRQCHHHKIAPHLIYDEAIAAIKEALAQPPLPVQEPVQPAQEPVAWVSEDFCEGQYIAQPKPPTT